MANTPTDPNQGLWQNLNSKKFIIVFWSLTCLFIILTIVILKFAAPDINIIKALLTTIGVVFTAYMGANAYADHYVDGKNNNGSVPDTTAQPDTTTVNNTTTNTPAGK